jgi:uncharacterized protein
MLMTPSLRSLLLVCLAGLIAACVPVTVNITFPQEKLEGAAGSIEDMVRSPENKPPASPKKTAPQSRLTGGWLAALGPRTAEAQVPEIRTRTPELMKAIESRRSRFAKIAELRGRGCVGETNQGLLEARPGEGCGADVAAVIAAENADRAVIYDTLMQQNNIPASDAPRVRAAFAKARHDRAKPGEWVQQPNGQWVKK